MAVLWSYIGDGYVNKKGEAPIYVSFYIAREKIVLPCKISVSLKAWDKEVGKVTTWDKFHADRNMMIDKIKNEWMKFSWSIGLPIRHWRELRKTPNFFVVVFCIGKKDFSEGYSELRFLKNQHWVFRSSLIFVKGFCTFIKIFDFFIKIENLFENHSYMRKTENSVLKISFEWDKTCW